MAATFEKRRARQKLLMKVSLALLVTVPVLAVGSGSGAVAGTVSPPHNGLIASRGSDGIYLIDARSSSAQKVPGTEEMGDPVWSPDGSLLAAEAWGDEEVSSVYTFRPDGTDRRLVLGNAWSPTWSPDGKRLLVIRDSCSAPYECADYGHGILATVRADGSDVHEIPLDQAIADGGPGQPTWSPDGKWIAFIGLDGGVMLVNPDGEAVRTVADSGYDLSWSPDGSKLTFVALDEKNDFAQEIVLLDVATGLRTALPAPRRRTISAPAWSPNGKQLAYLQSRAAMPKSDHGCGGELPMDVWAMNADGTSPHRLTKGKDSYGRPAWGTFRPEPKPSD